MTAATVIQTYLLISGLFTLSASLIWGVNTLFLLEAGLNIFEVFLANAMFTVGMVLFEIPTGVVADTRGRRISFLLSEATLLVGTLAYVGVAAIHGGVVLFSLAGIVLGLGYTFYSGAVEAWMVDALRATGYEGTLDRAFARGAIVSSAAMIVGTVGGGLLGSIDLSIPYLVRSAALAGALVIGAARMHDLGFQPRALGMRHVWSEMRKVGSAGLRFGWRSPEVRLLMVVSFVQMGFFSWAWYAWQPYFLDLLGSDAVWVAGVIAALFSLASILGNALVGRFERLGGLRTTRLIAASALLSAAVIVTGAIQLFWVAVPVFLLAGVAVGVIMPVKQTYLHGVIPSEQRATIVSFDNLLGSTGAIGGQAGLGYLSQAQSIPTAYVTGGLATLVSIPAFFRLRRRRHPADAIPEGRPPAPTPAADAVPEAPVTT
jgi:MFS family permease